MFIKYLCVYMHIDNIFVVPGPYPPPPGVHNVSPVRKWSPGEPGTAVDVRRKRVPSSEGKQNIYIYIYIYSYICVECIFCGSKKGFVVYFPSKIQLVLLLIGVH